jgi:ribosomal protein L17
MRHRVASKQLNRDTKHREALAKNMIRALVEHGRIQTTMAKAKVVQRIADKMVTKAKQGDVAARRGLHEVFGKRDVVNTLVDRVAPAFKNRTSGFTRITAIGTRAGDNTLMVELSWVDQPETVGTLTAPKTAAAEKKTDVKSEKTVAAKPAKKAAAPKEKKSAK